MFILIALKRQKCLFSALILKRSCIDICTEEIVFNFALRGRSEEWLHRTGSSWNKVLTNYELAMGLHSRLWKQYVQRYKQAQRIEKLQVSWYDRV